MITQTRIQELLDYDPIRGRFTWRVNRGGLKAGDEAGVVSEHTGYAYLRLTLDGVKYFAHKIAWIYVHGTSVPYIDHRDGDSLNNALTNLRPCDRSSNGANSKRRRDNKSGYKGVYWDTNRNGWCAVITCRGKQHRLGKHPTPEDAHAAYVRAAQKLFGAYARAS